MLSENESHRNEYMQGFMDMAAALASVQREDGFWNVSLHDAAHLGGKETTGTSLFTYWIAWVINNGFLDRKKYLPIVLKAWNAMASEAVHKIGFLGYVQGTGKEPKDSQPVSYTGVPDFEDFGLCCFCLPAAKCIN